MIVLMFVNFRKITTFAENFLKTDFRGPRVPYFVGYRDDSKSRGSKISRRETRR